MKDELGTYAPITWCPGCGNFGILNAFKRAVKIPEEKENIPRHRIAISAGIGCHAKIFDYLNLGGIYSIHGRAAAAIRGIKFAAPRLKVIGFAGDGDAYGEGIAHLIRRKKKRRYNNDYSQQRCIRADHRAIHTDRPRGFKGPSTPFGSPEEPMEPPALMLMAGATFVARGYSGKIAHLTDLIVRAVKHRGFSVIDVLQPCVTYNNTYSYYNEHTEIIEREPPDDIETALNLMKKSEKIPLGIFYLKKKEVFRELSEINGKNGEPKGRIDIGERRRIIRQILTK